MTDRIDPIVDQHDGYGVLHRYDPGRDLWYHPDGGDCRDQDCLGNYVTYGTGGAYVTRERPIRWGPLDLDRCVHGRHSIDPCLSCPGGTSAGNTYLMDYEYAARTGQRVRIGTTVRAEGIYVVPLRRDASQPTTWTEET